MRHAGNRCVEDMAMRFTVKILKTLPRSLRCLILAACVSIICFLFIMLVLPEIVKKVAAARLSKFLHRTTTIQAISFNPASLTLDIRGFVMRERDSDKVFVSFDLLRIDAEILSVFKRGCVLREIRLVNPYVNLIRHKTNTYNFSDMLPGGKKEKIPAEEPTRPFRFSLNNISISGGRIDFDDRPAGKRHTVTDITCGIPLLSNFDYHIHTFVHPSFSATINGKPFALAGKTKPFAESRESVIDINLRDVNLPEYLGYVPMPLRFKMPSGRLTTQLRIRFMQDTRDSPILRINGMVSLGAIELVTPDDKPIASIPSLSLRGINCMIRNRALSIDLVTANGIRLRAQRGKDGLLNVQTLAGASADNCTKPVPKQGSTERQPWEVTVKKFMLSNSSVAVEDNFPQQPAMLTFDNIHLHLTNISTSRESQGELDVGCLFNSSGSVKARGTITLDPLRLTLNLDLANIAIRPAQAYFPDTFKLLLTSGSLNLKGLLELTQEKGLQPVVTYTGDLGISDFAVVSQKQTEELLRFKSLSLSDIRMKSNPLALVIDTVTLSGAQAKPVIEPDGSSNLAAIAEPAPKTENGRRNSAKAAAQKPLNLKIGSIVLDNGRVTFTDKSVKPRFSADLAAVQGRITNVTLHKQDTIGINLSGKLNRYAPLTITGTAIPLREKPFVDMKILFKNIDLSPFSPYAGKFIGRKIAKGRLSLDLAYLINNNQLTAQNKIRVEQFNLGDDVKSPDATGLPVGLAVSLLKDRNGNINLDLPLSGNLDDPQFSLTGLIMKALVNLIEKAATSPFALLSNAFSGSGDLSSVLFDCGSAVIKAEEAKKIDALVQVLVEKPDIKLEIQGRADPVQDTAGLRERMVMNKIKQQKLIAMAKQGKAAPSVESITIEPDEYEEYLLRAYRAEPFRKPAVLGIPKRLPPEEMKKLMIDHTVVTDEDLRELMAQRALAVRQRIADSGRVENERILIVDPKVVEQEGGQGACRVDFMLR